MTETEMIKSTQTDFDQISQTIQELLGPKERYSIVTNRGNAGDQTPYLFMTRDHGFWRLVFEDTMIHGTGRVIDLRLYCSLQTPVNLRYVESGWKNSSKVVLTKPLSRKAREAHEIIGAHTNTDPLELIRLTVEYFKQIQTSS